MKILGCINLLVYISYKITEIMPIITFFCVAIYADKNPGKIYVYLHSPLYTFLCSFFSTECQNQILFYFQPFSAINIIYNHY